LFFAYRDFISDPDAHPRRTYGYRPRASPRRSTSSTANPDVTVAGLLETFAGHQAVAWPACCSQLIDSRHTSKRPQGEPTAASAGSFLTERGANALRACRTAAVSPHRGCAWPISDAGGRKAVSWSSALLESMIDPHLRTAKLRSKSREGKQGLTG
jgi:predicted RNA-binding Zn ribbon-like protein